jgi:subtilisin family serine protease
MRNAGGARRLGMALALAGVAVLASVDAHADAEARRLVPLLRGASSLPVRHPLADPEGRIPLVVRLPVGQEVRAHGLLPLGDGVGALRLAPDAVAAFAAAHPDWQVWTGPPRRPQLDYSGANWTRATPFRAATGLDGSGVVVGIIDTGIDVMHRDFRDASGKTRIAWLLRREPPRGKHPELEARFGCTEPAEAPCAIYDAADLDAAIANGTGPSDTNGHGTHVAAIAAGNGSISSTSEPAYVGVAPGATLVVAAPSSEGFSDPDILNAARFVFDRADAMNLPVVLNASLGSEFGPHDGTSELERGLAAMVGDAQPGRAVVVAAGNEGSLYPGINGDGPYGIHTEVFVSRYGTTRVPVVSPGAKGPIAGAGFVWLTFDPGDTVEVGLDGPGGAVIPFIAPGDDRGWHDDRLRAGVINSETGASRIPAGSRGAIVTWSGTWDANEPIELLLRGAGHARLWLSATGGAAYGNGLGLMFPRARRSGTVAVPASHPDLIAVGCTVNRRAWPMLEGGVLVLADMTLDDVCSFSAAGPNATGAMKPDLLAPGMNIVSAMSRDVDPRTSDATIFAAPECPQGTKYCYLADDTHAVSSGTSMSSPQVAGAIALLLQRDPTLTQRQLLQVLQGSAARASGGKPFDVAAGPGRIDLLGALELIDGRALSVEASAEASWFNLSSDYLRSDAVRPIVGVLELRDAEGHLVGTAPSGTLELLVEGARVTESLARVAPGLWRFAVAALPNSGGTKARIEIKIRGKSLGSRLLNVVADPWLADGYRAASGGCSVATVELAQSKGRDSTTMVWLVVAALGALSTRAVTSSRARLRSRR